MSECEQNSILGEIQSSLQSAAERAERGGWTDRQWTREVKNSLEWLGKEHGFDVYASGCDAPKGPEWLYDMVWLSYQDGSLADVPLVMESEWRTLADAYDDFEKLLLAKAQLRVLIFSRTTVKAALKEFEELERRTHLFRPPSQTIATS